MKTTFLLLISIIVFLISPFGGWGAFAQSFTINPQGTALTNANSTTNGALMPRMTLTQRNNIPLSAGLQVFCSDCSPAGPYAYNGGSWLAMFQTVTVSPITYTIGQAAQGGIIFWIDPNSGGQHGLVAAVSDQTNAGADISGRQWSNGGTVWIGCGAFAAGTYGGQFNTDKIIAAQGMGLYAAQMCRTYYVAVDGNYGDWYLPSFQELYEMYLARAIIGNFDVSGTAPTHSRYWSSTEYPVLYGESASRAASVSFSNGNIDYQTNKYNEYRVRAVRKF